MIGDELRETRRAAGLTQEDLADLAGVHSTYISLLERNRKSPTVEVLQRICSSLGLPMSEFMRRVEQAQDRR